MKIFTILLPLCAFFPPKAISTSSTAERDDCGGGDNPKENQPFDKDQLILQHIDQVRPKYETYNEQSNQLLDTYKNKQKKRQVGVVYGDGKPIGILQPYKRSYKFMPVNEEMEANPLYKTEDFPNPNSGSNLNKREAYISNGKLQEYPSIFTNFRINAKLDKKRFQPIVEPAQEEAEMPKKRMAEAPREMRSVHVDNELKDILTDLGLLDDESHEEKRDVSEQELALREKREEAASGTNKESSPPLNGNQDTLNMPETNVGKNSPIKRRNTDYEASNAEKEDNELKKRDDQIKQKSPEDSEYESKIQKQIQDKIDSLKEQVKRELESIKSKKEETQRKKRNTFNTLMDVERDDLNPSLIPEGDMRTLVRKKRTSRLKNESSNNINNTENKVKKKRVIGSNLLKNDQVKSEDSEYDENYNQKRKTIDDDNDHGDDVEVKQKSPEDSEYKSKIQMQIQAKINALNEQDKSKLDFEGVESKKEVTQRKKRNTFNTLMDVERDDLNPSLIPEGDMRTLVRKKKTSHLKNEFSSNINNTENKVNQKVRKKREIGSNLLKNDQLESEDSEYDENCDQKREAIDDDEYGDDDEGDEDNVETMDRNKRSENLDSNPDLYERIYNDDDKMKQHYYALTRDLKSRLKRTADESMGDRPQQLSDLSDMELFGALPQGYNGELSRYKRVKRNKKAKIVN